MNQMYRCIIIDDEPHAIDSMEMYIAAMPELSLVESFTDPLDALNGIKRPVDLIFLDIDMPRINGIELAREIRNWTKLLIFTTAHAKYALEAFDVHADGYLLKPFSLGKFMITINRLISQTAGTPDATPSDDYFFIKNKAENLQLTKIYRNEIVALESRRNDVLIHTLKKQVLTYISLTEITKLLNNPDIIQVHRSFMVNKNQIEGMNGNQLKLVNGLEITVGETFRKDFIDFITKNLFRAGKKSVLP